MEQSSIPRDSTVILVHPCEIIRHSIGLLLKQSGYQVPLLVESCEFLLEQLGDEKADSVIIHYSQCRSKGIIERIVNRTGANVALLASSDAFHHDVYSDMLDWIAEGVTGFLDMDETVDRFLSELDDIISGDMIISKNFIRNLKQKFTIIEEQLDKILSEREIGILNLVGKGNTNKEIGEELFISENTVKVHLRNILTKLNLKNRQQLMAFAIRKEVIDKYDTG